MKQVSFKRIYHDFEERDGVRVLVDRLWPRGVSKERAKLDFWIKEVGPSHELRKWFQHDPEKFAEFKEHYLLELQKSPGKEALEELKEIEADRITLLTAAKETSYNHLQILKEILEEELENKEEPNQ